MHQCLYWQCCPTRQKHKYGQHALSSLCTTEISLGRPQQLGVTAPTIMNRQLQEPSNFMGDAAIKLAESKSVNISIALLNSINRGHNGNAPAPRHSIWKVVSSNRIIRTVTVATLSKKKKEKKKRGRKNTTDTKSFGRYITKYIIMQFLKTGVFSFVFLLCAFCLITGANLLAGGKEKNCTSAN